MMKKKFPSRTFALMLTATGALAVMLIFMMGSAFAQVSIENNCPDKCESDTLYLKGVWDEKLKACSYDYQESCEYGCKSNIPACKDFPDDPPTDVADYDETLWKMQKWVYEKKDTEVFVDVHGTEYMAGEDGKIFVQLLNSSRQAIDDSTCFATAYYPNETKFIDDSLMSHVGDNGLYSFDVTIPDTLGVYMLSSRCYIPQIDQNESFAWDDFECNDFDCGAGWSSDWTAIPSNEIAITTSASHDGIYGLDFGDGGSASPEANRTLLLPSDNTTINYIVLTFWAKKAHIAGDDVVWFYFCDSSDICSQMQTWNVISPGTWQYYSYTFSDTIYDLTPGTITIKFNATNLDGTGDGLFLDTFNITRFYDFNQSQYQEVNGAGEIHVSDIPFETYMEFATLPEPILESNHDFCIDNVTMGKTLTWEQCIGNNCRLVSRNETEPCPYGCFGNETVGRCNPEPFDRITFIALIFLVIIVIIVGIAIAYDRFTK